MPALEEEEAPRSDPFAPMVAVSPVPAHSCRKEHRGAHDNRVAEGRLLAPNAQSYGYLYLLSQRPWPETSHVIHVPHAMDVVSQKPPNPFSHTTLTCHPLHN